MIRQERFVNEREDFLEQGESFIPAAAVLLKSVKIEKVFLEAFNLRDITFKN